MGRNLDKIGTILGFLSAILFLLAGVLWPVEYSNLALILGLDNIQDSSFAFKVFIQLSRFFDIKSVFIVFGGTVSVTFIAFPLHRIMRSFKNLRKVFSRERGDTEADHIFAHAKSLSEKRYQGRRITNSDIAAIENPFMKRWVEQLIVREQVSESMIKDITESEILRYEAHEEHEIEVLDFMSTAAPAFGMMGTIVGLVLMLAETGSVRAVMQSMSIAMLTTLYGVILSNMMLQPLVTKRKQLKDSNMSMLEMARETVFFLSRRETPYNVIQALSPFLPQKRDEFDEQYN